MGKKAQATQEAVIYCYIATRRQKASGFDPLVLQEKACRKFLNDHDLNVGKVYREYGAGDRNDRPVLREMLDYLEASERPMTVTVTSENRLSRDVEQFLKIRRRIKNANAELISLDIETALATGRKHRNLGSPEQEFLRMMKDIHTDYVERLLEQSEAS